MRSSLLHLRPPQSQGTLRDVIRKIILTYSLQLQGYKGSAHVPRSVWRVSHLVVVGAAGVVQVADANKGKFIHNY